MPDLTIKVSLKGPFFHSRPGIIKNFLEEARVEVARQSLAEVHTFLNAQIVNPTPYYETQIIVERDADREIVHDRGIIYGPWLEGISTRNRTTRFKGYASFRKATQNIKARVPWLVAAALRRAIARLNG